MNPKVYIIVLNWNMADDSVECIDSLKKLNYDNFQILLIDNGSSDESVTIFKKRFPGIEMIQNKENEGYAGGNNIAMKHAIAKGADYIFIVNNDVILDSNCVNELIDAAKEKKEGGIFAPKVYYYDHPKTINSLGTSMDWFRLRPYLGFCGQEDKGQFDQIRKTEILVGCALLVKKETIEKIGLIDEKFFLFHEEADWCLRIIRRGFKNFVIPKAVAYHKVSITAKKIPSLVSYYNIRNFLYLAYKNASSFNRVKVMLGLSYLICKNIVFLIFNPASRNISKAFLFGVLDYFMGQMGKCKRGSQLC